jgi:hypothetical protein
MANTGFERSLKRSSTIDCFDLSDIWLANPSLEDAGDLGIPITACDVGDCLNSPNRARGVCEAGSGQVEWRTDSACVNCRQEFRKMTHCNSNYTVRNAIVGGSTAEILNLV